MPIYPGLCVEGAQLLLRSRLQSSSAILEINVNGVQAWKRLAVA